MNSVIEKSSNTSIVICAKNEESRIEDCLKSCHRINSKEIVVIVGQSTDSTFEIAKRYATTVVKSNLGTLAQDRQLGIDMTSGDYVLMVDADHRLNEKSLEILLADLEFYGLDVVQAQLRQNSTKSVMSKSEACFLELFHSNPGRKKMIGTAPTLYKKQVFSLVSFSQSKKMRIDDTDFMYRLSLMKVFEVGLGRAIVFQSHHSSLSSYLKKFWWYGQGDYDFCVKYKSRAPSLIFHVLFRYPIIYSFEIILKRKPYALIYSILHGLTRFFAIVFYTLKPVR